MGFWHEQRRIIIPRGRFVCGDQPGRFDEPPVSHHRAKERPPSRISREPVCWLFDTEQGGEPEERYALA